jgi:hypothetical protein
MDSETVFMLRLLQRTEQMQAALAAGDKAAEAEAREILRRVQTKGSCSLLAMVYRGIILAWDEDLADWERIA